MDCVKLVHVLKFGAAVVGQTNGRSWPPRESKILDVFEQFEVKLVCCYEYGRGWGENAPRPVL